MVAIIDYGVGNLFSLKSSLDAIDEESIITSDKETIQNADRVILPGVGAFEDAINKLENSGLKDLIIELSKQNKPILGICLGMQLLFEKSYEFGVFNGLGIIKGDICPIKDDVNCDLKIPHMGWNSLQIVDKNNLLFKYINDNDYVYFVHSFYAKNCEESLTSYTEYGAKITATVAKGNTYGCQFHPEKSGEVGLKILKAFCKLKG